MVKSTTNVKGESWIRMKNTRGSKITKNVEFKREAVSGFDWRSSWPASSSEKYSTAD